MRSRIVQRESDAERALRVKSGAHAVIVARENRSGSGDVRARIEHIVPGQTQGLHVAGVDLAKAEINRLTLADIVTSERHRLLTACRDDLATETVDVDRPFEALARSEEHTSELQSLMRISYAVFCLKKQINKTTAHHDTIPNNS